MSKKVYSSIGEMLVLEELITRGREFYDLRYSTDADLDILKEPKVGNAIKAEITEWCFVTLEDKRSAGSQLVFLTGIKDQHIYTMTSDVVAYNPDRNLVFTKSGSIYYLSGPAAALPLGAARIAAIAAIFNGWGIGHALGMPMAYF